MDGGNTYAYYLSYFIRKSLLKTDQINVKATFQDHFTVLFVSTILSPSAILLVMACAHAHRHVGIALSAVEAMADFQ